MNCLCEALGMALPGNGTILAVDIGPAQDESAPGGVGALGRPATAQPH